MDYQKILLKGISNENSNKYLSDYFKREFKKGKKDNYKSDEFFNGLKSIIKVFKSNLQSQLYKRKSELEFMLQQAKNKTVKFNEKVQPDLTYEEKCDFLANNCKSELNDLSKNNFYITINKTIENKSITRQLSYSEIKRIDKSIFLAEKEIQLNKFQKQVSKIQINTSNFSHTETKNKQPQPIIRRYSALEWATIFYYANESKLLPENPTIKEGIVQFRKDHSIETTFGNLKTKYYKAKKEINKENNYPIHKLKKIISFLKEHYPITVINVENDITFLKENSLD